MDDEASAPRGSRHRYLALDGLRGVAALAVVVHHLAQATGRDIFDAAPLAVDFFFCLSGFVLAHAYQDKLAAGMSIAAFAWRRVLRLYPMYVLGAVLGIAGLAVLKAGGLTDLTWAAIAKATFLNLLYLPYFNWGYQQIFEVQTSGALFPSNQPAWSLFFELVANAIYAVVAVVGRHALLVGVAAAGLALCLAAAVYGRAPGWGSWNFLGGLPRVVFAFFCGTLIHAHRERLRALPRIAPAVIVAGVIAMFAVPRLAAPWSTLYWLACALAAVPLLVALGANCELRPGSRIARACDYLGRMSYPLYCLHFPLLAIVSTLLRPFHDFALLLAGFLALCLVASHLMLEHVDEPFRRWLGARVAARWSGRTA